jgi:hypothetical protein
VALLRRIYLFTEILLMAQLIETVGIGSSRVVAGDQTAGPAHGPASQAEKTKTVPAQDRCADRTGTWGRFLNALMRAFSAPAF